MSTLLSHTLLFLSLPSILPSLSRSPSPLPPPSPPPYHDLIFSTHLVHEALLILNSLTEDRLNNCLADLTANTLSPRDGSVFNIIFQLLGVDYWLWKGEVVVLNTIFQLLGVDYSLSKSEVVVPVWLMIVVLVDKPWDVLGVFGTRPLAPVWGMQWVREVVRGEEGEEEAEADAEAGWQAGAGEDEDDVAEDEIEDEADEEAETEDEADADGDGEEAVAQSEQLGQGRSVMQMVRVITLAFAKLIYNVVTIRYPGWKVIVAAVELVREVLGIFAGEGRALW